jgi:hypothetical protein
LLNRLITDIYDNCFQTRTKTSIRYAKEIDREKREKERERKKGRRRDIEREGEIRERERKVKGIDRERV